MKETSFIKQNKKKWARFEKLAGQKNNDPDEVSKLFTEITEDLSYARTFYPRRSVRVYLNQLAQGVFTSLYRQRKQPLGSFTKFWKETVPLEMYRARYNLLVSFIFFSLAIVVGAISQHYDPDFVKLILGDIYVEETKTRIAKGDPMGVYGEMKQTGMFLFITMNNIRVAFLAFTLGILATIGTYALLLYNGIMLGSFQWWFKAQGLLITSFLAVWIHGAFEISSIVIAGAAGITVGNGWLFPRSFSRVQSLIFAAKRGMTIMLSLVPFFIVAGFLESFVTRYYASIPNVIKLGIILVSFGIIILYYVIYPFIVARRMPEKIEVKEVPRFIPERKMEWHKIRKVGEVFTDTFYLFIKHIGKISRLFVTLILPLCIALIATIYTTESSKFDYDLSMMQNLEVLFGTGSFFVPYIFFGWSVILTLLFCSVFYVIRQENEDELFLGFFKFVGKHGLWMWLFTLLTYSILVFAPLGLIFICIFLSPFISMIPAIIVHEKKDFFTAFARSFSLGRGAYGDSLGSFAIFLLIFFIFKFSLENPIPVMGLEEWDGISIIDRLVKEVTITLFDNYQVIISCVNSYFFMLFLFIVLAIYALSFSLSYYSSNEMKTAQGLYARLEHFGKRNKTRETEVDYE